MREGFPGSLPKHQILLCPCLNLEWSERAFWCHSWTHRIRQDGLWNRFLVKIVCELTETGTLVWWFYIFLQLSYICNFGNTLKKPLTAHQIFILRGRSWTYKCSCSKWKYWWNMYKYHLEEWICCAKSLYLISPYLKRKKKKSYL